MRHTAKSNLNEIEITDFMAIFTSLSISSVFYFGIQL